jgi:hypothetical protein
MVLMTRQVRRQTQLGSNRRNFTTAPRQTEVQFTSLALTGQFALHQMAWRDFILWTTKDQIHDRNDNG